MTCTPPAGTITSLLNGKAVVANATQTEAFHRRGGHARQVKEKRCRIILTASE
jgi:hypothetical protein